MSVLSKMLLYTCPAPDRTVSPHFPCKEIGGLAASRLPTHEDMLSLLKWPKKADLGLDGEASHGVIW